ncbi:PQQ-dependent sugar dehydrogenase [Paludisphaera rhizosphaerae]|uniref:PQQ-dependent sugar dehydrogenase n=1 Tax=Paludisphaera rhizosphaerae TaxID=2711216 RepID=UPI0013ED2F94|nr:sorbosone dehydrogenase family protein [Paludisphaera rhizosphaerae]
MTTRLRHALSVSLGLLTAAPAVHAQQAPAVLTGKAAQGDWTTDAPGVRRKITVDDLAPPFDTESAQNHPRVVKQPEGAWPKAPEGFEVTKFATDLKQPRVIVTAPNGDFFVAESAAGRVHVFRDADGDGKPEASETFAADLKRPFGIAFYPLGAEPKYVYVANTDSVVRFPYANGDLKATGPAQVIVESIPSGNEKVGGGGHWTRDLQFSPDGKTLFVSVGSRSNVTDDASETRRADILAFDPEGKNERIYAWGIRNPVGLAIDPATGKLWTSVNERDGLGDDLVPDYITHVEEGGFYGWPWYYISGSNQDPRHKGKRPELKSKVIVPDVLVQAHSASLDLTFYDGASFPDAYKGDIFASEHGSWNRARRTGYKVIRVPLEKGVSSGVYEDFLVGFVTPDGNVWGRPVGVAVAKDGSLMVTDDASGTVWRVAYVGKK